MLEGLVRTLSTTEGTGDHGGKSPLQRRKVRDVRMGIVGIVCEGGHGAAGTLRFRRSETGGAWGIAPTPSTNSGQALRKEREEWGTRFVARSHEIKGWASRPKKPVNVP
jgi:hypothetical protein